MAHYYIADDIGRHVLVILAVEKQNMPSFTLMLLLRILMMPPPEYRFKSIGLPRCGDTPRIEAPASRALLSGCF